MTPAIPAILRSRTKRRLAVSTLRRAAEEWDNVKLRIPERSSNQGLQDKREYADLASRSCAALASLYRHADKPYPDVEETYWDIVPWNPATIHLTATGDCALA